MPSPFRRVELALYTDKFVKATLCQPALLAKYLETYISYLERCLSEKDRHQCLEKRRDAVR
jgi:hypothetical protein